MDSLGAMVSLSAETARLLLCRYINQSNFTGVLISEAHSTDTGESGGFLGNNSTEPATMYVLMSFKYHKKVIFVSLIFFLFLFLPLLISDLRETFALTHIN